MNNETSLTFSSSDSRFQVIVEPSAMQALLAHCQKAGRKETGGILIGSIDARTGVLTIAEATPKPRDSLFSWFSFQRGSEGLTALLSERWQLGQHYVGEWHFHPGGSPQPSQPDVQAMRKIAADQKYQCKEPVLVIVGGWPRKQITTSMHVFPRDESYIELAQKTAASS